jgi:hypothetical protein
VNLLAAPLSLPSPLIVDYGHDESGFGDTLQACAAHRFAAPLPIREAPISPPMSISPI